MDSPKVAAFRRMLEASYEVLRSDLTRVGDEN
jgi:hypothetical protein